jgi:osmotically-inducible protein OsmY
VTDKTLQQAVLDELAWEPSVNAAHVGVTARDGVITLSGHVGSFSEKWAVERVIGHVAGVRAIVENLDVRPFPDADHGDEDIAKRALSVLSWNVLIPDGKVNVKVEAGWLTLTGEVDWYYQKDAAQADVRKLQGVVGVSNEIAIKPSVRASDVHDKIAAALGRNAQIEANAIVVTATGGKITLGGSVDTYYERRLAVETAWSAPGVIQVEDNLSVV